MNSGFQRPAFAGLEGFMNFKDIVAGLTPVAVALLLRLGLIALILLVTIIVSRRTQRLVRRLSAQTMAPPEIGELLGRIARIAILIVGVLWALQQLGWGEAVLSFVAGFGIAGLVIGFALQDIVKQFAAGVLLLMLRPFRVGDKVQIGDFEGTVIAVQLRATVLKTAAGDEVLIPNADVYTTAIVNLSRYEVRRRTITLNVPAEIDLERVDTTLIQVIGDVPGVVADPPPAIIGTSLDGTTVKIEVHFWVDERRSNPDVVTTNVIAAARRALSQAGTGA
jgi:small-conductance mechanosensitive channel